jgi:hypothetical protein
VSDPSIKMPRKFKRKLQLQRAREELRRRKAMEMNYKGLEGKLCQLSMMMN